MPDWSVRPSRRAFMVGAAGLALEAQSTPVSDVDSDGMLRIRGRRTFLHGLYQAPNVDAPLRAVAAAGFHVIHCDSATDLDAARDAGLHGWLTVGSNPMRIAEAVERHRAHPALLYWETEDEPSYQWNKPGPRVAPHIMRAAYAQLKKLDPGRIVYLNHSPTNLVSTLREYNPGGDLLATDIYPVVPHGIRPLYALWPDGRQGDLHDTHVSQVGRYMDKLREVAGNRRAAAMVLQAFAWENLREKDRDARMVVYPTAEQLRFMAFHAIVRGANALIWWGLKFTPEQAPVWPALAALTKELRTLDTELAAVPLKTDIRLDYHDTGHSLDRGIEWMVKPGPLCIAVNADPNPVEVTVHGLSAKPRRERFEPFDVRLLRG